MRKKKSPFTNWKWWLMLAPMLLIAIAASVLIVIKALGEIAEDLAEILHASALRPIFRWTWGVNDA